MIVLQRIFEGLLSTVREIERTNGTDCMAKLEKLAAVLPNSILTKASYRREPRLEQALHHA